MEHMGTFQKPSKEMKWELWRFDHGRCPLRVRADILFFRPSQLPKTLKNTLGLWWRGLDCDPGQTARIGGYSLTIVTHGSRCYQVKALSSVKLLLAEYR